jgi:CelD/BcsL family acetyltransferase involved in cellulose biosynthesis
MAVSTRCVEAATASSLEPVWSDVYGGMADASPFVSPLWTRTWLDVHGPRLRPSLLTFVRDGAPIGACLLTPRVRYGALLPLVRLHVNTDGEPESDSVVVEHNAVLALPGREAEVTRAFAAHVATRRVDELVAAGFDEAGVERLVAAFPGWRPIVEWREDPYVDLARLRVEGGDHLAMLSRNTRAQLRRSMARYRERGALALVAATTPSEADGMLDELVALHQAHWQSRGKPGGFASPLRQRFHRQLIRAGVADGTVQLLRVMVGGETMAVLYNLVANGRVNFYQSGIRYEPDPHLRPGMVAHHLAITHNLDVGMAEYDFLVSGRGEGRYKRSLANASRQLGWVTLHRPGWRRRYFDFVRAVRRQLHRRRRAVATDDQHEGTAA